MSTETRVIAVFSASPGSLLPSRAEAEIYAEYARGLYLRQDGSLSKRPARGKNPVMLRVVSYAVEEFPHRPGMGRILATCERY